MGKLPPVPHVAELSATRAGQFHHRPELVVRDLDNERLKRLERRVALLVEDDARLADGELVALAPHRLDEDGEMEQAATGDGKIIGARDLFDAQGDVPLELLHEPVAQMPGGEVLAGAARQRRAVDAEDHVERRFVDGEALERAGIGRIADRVADLDVLHPADGADVTGGGLLGIDLPQLVEELQPANLRRHERPLRR